MSETSDRARELGEWLRDMSVRGGKGVVDNVDARSLGRVAETLESLLAENERLRVALRKLIEAATDVEVTVLPVVAPQKPYFSRAQKSFTAAMSRARAALNAEPESDPGLPAGSSAAEVAERCAQIAESHPAKCNPNNEYEDGRFHGACEVAAAIRAAFPRPGE